MTELLIKIEEVSGQPHVCFAIVDRPSTTQQEQALADHLVLNCQVALAKFGMGVNPMTT